MTIGRKGHVSAGLSVQETIGQPTELDKQFSRYLASFPASSSRLTLRPSPNKAVQSRLWLNSHRCAAYFPPTPYVAMSRITVMRQVVC